MCHVMFVATAAITVAATVNVTTLAPAPRPLSMGQPAATRALVSPGALAPGGVACQATAWPTVIAVATVAAAAQHDLDTATRAQEQAAWRIHVHLGEPKVLDGHVPTRQTDVAPPYSARCGARFGRQACQPEKPLPRPPSSA